MKVFFVTPLGTCHTAPTPSMRLAAEAARIEAVRANGRVPEVCGPEMPEAPARGTFCVVEFQAMYPEGEDGYVMRPSGHQGRKTMQMQDVFGVMLGQAARARRPAPLSPGQIAMGRHYAALVEMHRNAGLRCSSVEAAPGGGGGTFVGYMDSVCDVGRKIATLQRRIGDGPAPRLRVLRPSQRGSRVTITARALVDAVCLESLTLDVVLARHGWSRKGETRQAAREALADCLERMMGPMRGRGITAATFGDGPRSIWSRDDGA